MLDRLQQASLYVRTAQRVARTGGMPTRGFLGEPDPRVVFVHGCPRSGTTFLASAIASLPGFVDLGEVGPLKRGVADLIALEQGAAAERIRRIVTTTARLGLAGGRRVVEQTPETSFVAAAAAEAFTSGSLVHIARDGRDVVCSLLERGWLSAGRVGQDDVGETFGARLRFWVEPEREAEFAAVSDARRAAWAWRRYVESALVVGPPQIRYEEIVEDSAVAAERLAPLLACDPGNLAHAFARVRPDSLGRFRSELSAEQVSDIEDEAGELLESLGYT